MADAFYYPYTQVHSFDALKSMILYFDKIHVMSPYEASIGQANRELETLESNHLIKYVSPSELLKRYDRLLTRSVINDLTDHQFLTYSSQRGSPWQIFSEKIPSDLGDYLLRKYFVDIPNFYSSEKTSHFLREGPHNEISEMNMRELIEQRHDAYMHWDKIAKDRDVGYREFRQVTLPFEVGESLMINHALCASSSLKLTPVTDIPLHHDFLIFKMAKMTKNPLFKNILKDYRYIKNVKIDLAAVNVISETLPALKGAHIEDLLEFRDENKDALNRLKVEMGKLATDIQSSYWDPDFQKEVIDLVDSKVKPSIEEVRISTESAKEKLIRIFKRGATISPLPIVATVAPGCIPELALMASAGVVALGEYLEYLKNKRVRQRNGFAYLFDAQRKLKLDQSQSEK